MKIQFYINEFLTQSLEAKMLQGESPHLAAKRLLEGILNGESPSQPIQPDLDALAELQNRLSALENQKINQAEETERTHEFLEKTMDAKSYDLLIQYGEKLEQLEKQIPNPAALQLEHDSLTEVIGRLEKLEMKRGGNENRAASDSSAIDRQTQTIKEISDRIKYHSEKIEKIEDEVLPDVDKQLVQLAKNWDGATQFGERLRNSETKERILENHVKQLADRVDRIEKNITSVWISIREHETNISNRLNPIENQLSDKWIAELIEEAPTAPKEIQEGLTHKQLSEICGIAATNLGKLAKNRDRWPEGYMWSDESKKWFPLEV